MNPVPKPQSGKETGDHLMNHSTGTCDWCGKDRNSCISGPTCYQKPGMPKVSSSTDSTVEQRQEVDSELGLDFIERSRRALDLPYVSKLLKANSEIFAQRNAVYKDNFRMVGRIMKALFPDGPPKLETEADYNRWHLFELAIVKLSRYAINYDAGGHADSIDDLIVYMAMVAALDHENGHRD